MRGTSTPLAIAAGVLMLALATAGLPLPRAFPARALVNCDTSAEGLTSSELEMFSLINAERTKAGVPSLKISPGLNRAAAWKSADSSASGHSLSHQDSLGRMPPARARDCGYPGGAAENIAYGFPSAAATLTAWMGSPGHRANILNSTYKMIGIGLHGSAWTTNFGFADDSGATAPPPPPPPTTAPATQPPPPPTATATATKVPTATPTREPIFPAAGVRVELGTGANLVTYVGAEQPASSALKSLNGILRAVYEWNAQAGRWEKYIPGSPAYVSTFTTLKPGRAYILELTWSGAWIY